MTTQPVTEVAPQEKVVIEAAETAVPEELKAKAAHVIDNYDAFLKDRTEAYQMRLEAERQKTRIEAGGPVIGTYSYMNCMTRGPYQFWFNDRPNKIVAANEWVLMVGVIWINPATGPGGSLSGTTVLGSRHYRARFESVNLSDVMNGPDFLQTGVFSGPANPLTYIQWWFRPGDPGPNPKLYEVHFTVDVTEAGQPFAAFSTWHYDPEGEPPIPGFTPGMGAHLDHDIPARFLVYRK